MNKRLFKTIYIAIVVSSVLSLAALTVNYLQFYPALQSLRAEVEGQQIVRDPQNNPTQVLLHLRVSNPTGYSGLRVEEVGIHLYFTANNASLFQSFQLFGANLVHAPLGPGGSIQLDTIFPVLGNQSSVLANFLNNHGSSVVFHYMVEIHLFTFLDALAPTLEVDREVQYPPA